jgi:pimeloyl-ACP methyl ester carboxylesterase
LVARYCRDFARDRIRLGRVDRHVAQTPFGAVEYCQSGPVEDIAVPTLLVHAQDDPLGSYEDARAMVARIPGSRVVTVARGGHVLTHRDARARGEIAAFLAGKPRAAAIVHRSRANPPPSHMSLA